MGVHMPTLRDADRGIPKGGVAPVNGRLPRSGNTVPAAELLNGEIFYSLAEAAVLVEQSRREYNTVRPHSACGGFPPAPEAIKPSPWFLRMPVLHGPPQVLGLT